MSDSYGWIEDDLKRQRVARAQNKWLRKEPAGIVRWSAPDGFGVLTVQDRFGKVYHASRYPLKVGSVFMLFKAMSRTFGELQHVYARVIATVPRKEMVSAAGGKKVRGRYFYEIMAD